MMSLAITLDLEYKTCHWCLKTRPIERFDKSKNPKSGRENKCRECKNTQARLNYRYKQQKLKKEHAK